MSPHLSPSLQLVHVLGRPTTNISLDAQQAEDQETEALQRALPPKKEPKEDAHEGMQQKRGFAVATGVKLLANGLPTILPSLIKSSLVNHQREAKLRKKAPSFQCSMDVGTVLPIVTR